MKSQIEFEREIDRRTEKAIEEVVDQLCQQLDQHLVPNPLLTMQQQKERQRLEIREMVSGKHVRKRFAHGLVRAFTYFSQHLSPEECERMKTEWFDGIERIIRSEKEGGDEKKSSLEMAMGLSDATISHFYDAGMHFRVAGMWQDAADIFLALTILNPWRFNVWMAFGICHQQLKQYNEALVAYSTAIIMNDHAYEPYIRSAECFLQLGDTANAKGSLHTAEQLIAAADIPNKRPLIAYIKALGKAHK